MEECIMDMDILLMLVRGECERYRLPDNNDPIDEDDIAFMYLAGYMRGKGKDFEESREAAKWVAFHFMDRGVRYAMQRNTPKYEFRLSLE